MASVEEMVAAVHQINSMAEEVQGIVHVAKEKVDQMSGTAISALDGSNNINAQNVMAYAMSLSEDIETLQRKLSAIVEAGNGYIGAL